MRKLTFLVALMVLLCTGVAKATKVYNINEDFTTAPSPATWGFSAVPGHTLGYDAVNKRFTLRWGSPSSYTEKTFSSAIAQGSDNLITIEIIGKFYTSGNSSSSGNLYFLDSNGNAIFGFGVYRNGGQYRVARATNYPGKIAPIAAATTTDVLAADQPLAKITAVLNFSTHTLDYTAQVGAFDNATRVFTATSPSVSSTGQAFINSSANNFNSLLSNFYRSSTTSGTYGYDLMYFGVSTEQTVSTSNVTVKYKDQDNNYFKTDEVVAEQVVGSTYNATLAQKASVTMGGNTYVLNPSSPTSVLVADGASTLELLFRKATTFTTMTWNGTTDTNGNVWSEWYQNFISETTTTAYQTNATATFDATAVNPAVVVNDPINIGAGNIIISANGYNFSGNGALSGTGTMSINLSGTDAVSLGVTNNLSGVTTIAGGNITLNKSGAIGSSVSVNGTSTLIAGANAITIPAATFNSSSTIDAGSKYGTLISGITAGSGVKISVSGDYNTSNSNTVAAFAASGTLSAGSELELNGTGTTENKFGMTSASTSYLANAKVSLKGNAFLFIDTNQGAATTINVGTLSGESGTKLGWGRSSALDRTITWSIGALNESSEFAGTLTNTGGYNTGGSMYVGNATNLTKVGTGTLTLSGASTHNGAVAVSEGTINVTGSLGSGASVSVATGATLEGTGTISGTTTIDGTIKGSLNFNGAVTLNSGATVNTGASINLASAATLNVASASTTLEAINISSNATSAGKIYLQDGATIPTLTITSEATPELNKTFQIVNATTPNTIIYTNTPVVPNGFTYNVATGALTYIGVSTFINNGKTGTLSIYPTLSTGNVTIAGAKSATVEVVNIAGVIAKQIVVNNENATIQLNGLANGTYFVKVHLTDGSVKIQKVILQK